MEVALHSVGRAADARVAIVRSTLELGELWVSEALRDEVAQHPRLERISDFEELSFESGERLSVVSATHPMVDVPSSLGV